MENTDNDGQERTLFGLVLIADNAFARAANMVTGLAIAAAAAVACGRPRPPGAYLTPIEAGYIQEGRR